jgi:hypothetical protein
MSSSPADGARRPIPALQAMQARRHPQKRAFRVTKGPARAPHRPTHYLRLTLSRHHRSTAAHRRHCRLRFGSRAPPLGDAGCQCQRRPTALAVTIFARVPKNPSWAGWTLCPWVG